MDGAEHCNLQQRDDDGGIGALARFSKGRMDFSATGGGTIHALGQPTLLPEFISHKRFLPFIVRSHYWKAVTHAKTGAKPRSTVWWADCTKVGTAFDPGTLCPKRFQSR